MGDNDMEQSHERIRMGKEVLPELGGGSLDLLGISY